MDNGMNSNDGKIYIGQKIRREISIPMGPNDNHTSPSMHNYLMLSHRLKTNTQLLTAAVTT